MGTLLAGLLAFALVASAASLARAEAVAVADAGAEDTPALPPDALAGEVGTGPGTGQYDVIDQHWPDEALATS